MTPSLLAEGIRRTGTELWTDSAGADDLAWSIERGATGATSNPPIVLSVVRAEGRRWLDRAGALLREQPAATETEIAWALLEEVVVRGAGVLAPIFERTGGRQGWLSAQVDPRLSRDPVGMLAQAGRLASLAPNLQVKIPVTEAGLKAIEDATASGIEVNATANFTVAGAIAVAEAVERGLVRRAAAGIRGQPVPVCTLMVGRLDDWVKLVAERDGVLLTPGVADWAGVAVFKRAHAIYRARGYRTRLLAGAFRHHLPWTQLLGGDIILTIPPAWQRWIDASGLPLEPRMDEPVAEWIVDELRARSPEFVLAYEPDGLTTATLEGYGASRRTLRQFLAAWTDLQAAVREVIVPDPDDRHGNR